MLGVSPGGDVAVETMADNSVLLRISDISQTATAHCSSPLLGYMWENILASQNILRKEYRNKNVCEVWGESEVWGEIKW